MKRVGFKNKAVISSPSNDLSQNKPSAFPSVPQQLVEQGASLLSALPPKTNASIRSLLPNTVRNKISARNHQKSELSKMPPEIMDDIFKKLNDDPISQINMLLTSPLVSTCPLIYIIQFVSQLPSRPHPSPRSPDQATSLRKSPSSPNWHPRFPKSTQDSQPLQDLHCLLF